MEHNLWFVTFGDSRLEQAHRRIRKQADKMGVFGDRVRIFDENGLDADFCEKMKGRLIPGSRGFGYWCWKPQVILQVMREMPEGDVLLYADIGCHLNPKGAQRLEEYRQLAIKNGIVAFQSRALGEAARTDLRLHFLPERQWTKMDTLKYFGVADNSDILNSGQVGGGVLLFRKDGSSLRFVRMWMDIYFNHFEFVDDSPSSEPNYSDFIECGHDQSIISVLCKKNGIHLLSSGEYVHIRCYMPDGGNERLWPEYWSELKRYPVHAKRDLGKYTKMVECPDWLKPMLGKRGRRFASLVYEGVKPVLKIFKRGIYGSY